MSSLKEIQALQLQSEKVFDYFEEICAIPHGSRNTKAISDYLVAFAKKHDLTWYQDESNNVVIVQEATAGYEQADTIILQGHMDMVCEKESGCAIDFEKDGLDLYVDGDFLKARGTTLGGDDGIAVAYALILAFCYRSINLKSLWKILVDSAKMSGMVVFLVGVSNILGWVMAFLQIPDAVAAALLSLTSNKYIILLIMNVILLVSGTFMDVTPAILIFTPLFLPICQSFGMSTIQFGLILVYNLCIGNITPPVGNALFVGIKVGRTSLSKVMPYMLMYYVAIIGGLLLVTFIPAVSTALPQAMGLM